MIIGKHPPTEDTPGVVGQEYFDESTDTQYICVNVAHITSKIPGEHDCKYEWKVDSGSDGGLPKPIPYEYMPEGYPKVEMGDVTVLEEQTISGFVEGYGFYNAPISFNEIEVGRTYTVVFDGVSYECVGCFYEGVLYLGNRVLIDGAAESAPEPFVILYAPRGSNLILCATSEESHTVAIYTTGENIEPVAYKFMPDGYPKEETRVVFSVEDALFAQESNGVYFNVEPIPGFLIIGEKYTVEWDGIKYENLVAFSTGKYAAIGANGIKQITEEMPFAIGMESDGCIVGTNSTAATHSVTVTHEKITPLDKKFLPEGAGVIKYCVFGQDYGTEEYTSSMNYGEIRQSLLAGTMVLGVYGNFLLYPAEVPGMSDVSTFAGQNEIHFYHHTPNDSFRFLVRDSGYVGFTNYMGS